jgi:hypothetical protein
MSDKFGSWALLAGLACLILAPATAVCVAGAADGRLTPAVAQPALGTLRLKPEHTDMAIMLRLGRYRRPAVANPATSAYDAAAVAVMD